LACGQAEQLAEIGKHVTLVDRESGVLPVMDEDMTQPLLQQLDLHGVQTVLSDGVKGIAEQGGAYVIGVF
jgi:pyruvate/2-oxoglutarate dehydrogenase complex dihydrolipoamide dehydrogenase (E3) component